MHRPHDKTMERFSDHSSSGYDPHVLVTYGLATEVDVPLRV